MSILKQAANSIRESYEKIDLLTRDLPADKLYWKPNTNTWSIMEIVCHVEEVIPYWINELLAVIANPGKEWGRGLNDNARLAAVEAAEKRELLEVMTGIQQEVQQVESLFERLSDDILKIESPSRNPRFQPNMHFLIQHLLVEHLEKHANQIDRNLKQYAEHIE